jgi:hypothetical protein
MVGAVVSFFGKRGMRLGLVVEGEDGHLELALELSMTTHPLQLRGLELDRQETGAAEVCESSFSFFLRQRWAGKGGQGKTQIGEESLSGQHEPQQYRGLIQGSNKRYCCARVLGSLQEKLGRKKVGREN